MSRWMLAAGFLAMIGIALAACSGDGDDTSFGGGGPCPGKTPPSVPSGDEMSVEELTDLVAEAITCPGYALHLHSADEQLGFLIESHDWIDIEANVSRSEMSWRPVSGQALRQAEEEGLEEDAEARYTSIFHADESYWISEFIGYAEDEDPDPASKRGPSDCHASGLEALGSLIPCAGPLSYWERTVELDAAYGERSAIALLTEGESGDADGFYDITGWLYFDPETLLPVGRIVETERGAPIDTDATYEAEFVSLDSLPDGFFDPASIGYVEPDPEDVEKPLDDAEVPVYWLGRTFDGEGEYPALALDRAFVRPEARSGEGGFVVEMTYRPADDEFGYYMARIDLFTPAAWEDREAITVHWPCEQTVDLEVDGHDATMKIHHWGTRQSADGTCLPPDRYSAVVHFDNVVVDIDAPATGGGRETFYSPYDSAEGIELLIRSLELRE